MLNKIKSAVLNTKKTLQSLDTVKTIQSQSRDRAAKRSGKLKPSDFAQARIKHPKTQKNLEDINNKIQAQVQDNANVDAIDQIEQNVNITQYTQEEFNRLIASKYFEGIVEGLFLGMLILIYETISFNTPKIYTSILHLTSLVFFYLGFRLMFGAVREGIAKLAKLKKDKRDKSYLLVISSMISVLWSSSIVTNYATSGQGIIDSVIYLFNNISIFGVIIFVIADFCLVYWKEIFNKFFKESERYKN